MMAGGRFIEGWCIELWGEGGIGRCYEGYVEGGLSYEDVKLGVRRAVEHMEEK
ncbi:methionine gamma-lyase family protein, partial [Staphylococcus epidermidis]|uniref:methionine gamma-lyase family protein n=1 Tax=Staphylococcus epidermidis TaxID=1282 RepID=UPI0037D99196